MKLSHKLRRHGPRYPHARKWAEEAAALERRIAELEAEQARTQRALAQAERALIQVTAHHIGLPAVPPGMPPGRPLLSGRFKPPRKLTRKSKVPVRRVGPG